MVFNRIKNLFSPSATHTLYKNNKKLITSTLSIKPHFITLSHISIPLTRIHNLSLTTSSLSFTYQNTAYKIEGPNLQSIYDQLNTLIKPKQLVFKSFNAKYYKFDNLIEPNVEVCIFKEICYYLMIVKDEVIHEEEITEMNSYRVEPGRCAFVWELRVDKGTVTYKVEFGRQIEYLEFLAKYTKCIMKHDIEDDENIGEKYDNSNMRYGKARDNIVENERMKDLGYENSMEYERYSDNENMSHNNSLHRENGNIQNNGNSENRNLENEFIAPTFEINDDQSYLFDTSSDEDIKNKNLTVSNKNKAFVTRGSSIGIFDLENENLNLQSTINLNIDPSKILHHNNSLIVKDESEKNKLYNIDLERGNITDEWDINRNITDYFDSHKQQSGDLVAVNENSLFKLDLRTPQKVVSENNYRTKTNFTCGMSSKDGNLAVANKKGDLRLYDNLEKRAKKLLHGLGDEIYSIDSTNDGQYVVCTTQKYLLFYDLTQQKIEPKRLQLRNEHLIYMNEISFTPAKFNHLDNCIVTSSGRFVITWNFCDISSNVYSIKKCKDVIVADSFTSGENILVAMPNDVKIVNKKKLKNTERIIRKDES